MISYFIAIAVLVVGYFAYSRVNQKIFGADSRVTPAIAKQDGVDFAPMSTLKAFFVQLLGIAGTGPVFGALMGATFGPIVFLWIVAGCLIGGAVHDYMIGMISLRNDGAPLAVLAGKYFGKAMQQIVRVITLLLLLLVGGVFLSSSASLINKITPSVLDKNFWVITILLYYLAANLLPINKLVGKIYPVFGVILISLVVAVGIGINVSGYEIPEIFSNFTNLHPEGKSVYPYMFITVACGAISGYHATQSSTTAKCIKSEKAGRTVFYGAMVAEGIIALTWAAAGVAFYGGTQELLGSINSIGQANVVYEICTTLFGTIGSIMAIIGVAICPMISGGSAFRSARMTFSSIFNIEQESFPKRIAIAVPLLLAGASLTLFDFNIIWRYFSLVNHSLSMICLWMISVYLKSHSKIKYGFLITALPAMFMSVLCPTYILAADETFRISLTIALPVGVAFGIVCTTMFVIFIKKKGDAVTDGEAIYSETEAPRSLQDEYLTHDELQVIEAHRQETNSQAEEVKAENQPDSVHIAEFMNTMAQTVINLKKEALEEARRLERAEHEKQMALLIASTHEQIKTLKSNALKEAREIEREAASERVAEAFASIDKFVENARAEEKAEAKIAYDKLKLETQNQIDSLSLKYQMTIDEITKSTDEKINSARLEERANVTLQLTNLHKIELARIKEDYERNISITLNNLNNAVDQARLEERGKWQEYLKTKQKFEKEII